MSTRCGIGALMAGGRVRGIYCHQNGGPWRNGVGWMLHNFYASDERVARLLELGDCSELKPGLGQRHDFHSSRPNWSVFYSRDRGERKPARVFDSVEEFIDDLSGQHAEFLYLWRGERGRWQVAETDSHRPLDIEWRPLHGLVEARP